MSRVGISGHRGLPPATEKIVSDALQAVLREHPADTIGVSCIADGADSLFAQAILDRGGQLEVIVPAVRYRAGLPAEHHPLYDQLLASAAAVHQLPFDESTSEAHMAASERMLDMIDELVAVWDGQPARGYGGTADVVAAAKARDLPVTIVWPHGAQRY